MRSQVEGNPSSYAATRWGWDLRGWLLCSGLPTDKLISRGVSFPRPHGTADVTERSCGLVIIHLSCPKMDLLQQGSEH